MFCSIKGGTYRAISEVCCWVNLIACTAAGYTIGEVVYGYEQAKMLGADSLTVTNYPIIGLLIGWILGLLTSLIYGGFVATFLRIDENTNLIRESQVPNGSVNAKPSPQVIGQPIAVPEK